MIEIDENVLKVVFDVAVESMDFGSGFLCDEEVDALRACAVRLGVDPMVATPENFKCKFVGKHEPYGEKFPNFANMCMHCKARV